MTRPAKSPGDGFHDECGVFGIFDHGEAANMAYLGLHALQHRGQESAGIVAANTRGMTQERDMGLVADIFTEDRLARLKGRHAIGHTRYSTAGSSQLINAQPFLIDCHRGKMAVAHNGNLLNAAALRLELERQGSIFSTSSDSEVILHLVARSSARTLEGALVDALSRVEGAYSLVFLMRDRLIAVRDPHGFRPLSLGKLDGAMVVASETCAFDLIGARFVRDVAPGEFLIIDSSGLRSEQPFPPQPTRQCIFEHVYFSRPDSMVFGRSVNQVRRKMGVALAREHPVPADIVVPVPDSGLVAALGFAGESGIPFEFGLVRNHYVGRTFIEPKQEIRHFGVKLKLNAVAALIKGKRVILVDDSIVRGTTSRKIVTMVRDLGAREVHMRISSPPTTGPCYYGVDTPRRDDLIASAHSVEEIRAFIRADSLGYLSLEGLRKAVDDGDTFCAACFDDNYPIAVNQRAGTQANLFDIPR
ncbi:MAG: amidophosphoribosyltransferase [Acidobacteria bacterium]|nr:MAG: amidophosphoribosyltransferase [Acidobacteriota bacterium]